MSNPDFIVMKSDEDWTAVKEKAKAENKQIFLAKLSPACPVSHMAEREIRDWHASNSVDGVIFAEVDVIRARNLARGIATEVGVQHQSPQVIVFNSEITPQWDESHQSIHVDFLKSKF